MKHIKKIGLALILAVTMAGCGGNNANNNTSTLDKIREADVLKVGVKDDRINFSLKDTATGTFEGYEVDIARAIAKAILGDENKVELIAVNAKTRTALLDSGEIDCMVATFTITDERKENWNISDAYYTDHVGIMTKKGRYNGLQDMDGTTIAVQQAATSQEAVKAAADEIGVSVTFKEYGSAAECVAALNSGVVDGYSIDVAQLMSYLNADLEVLEDRFSPQEFGIATRKADQELADEINAIIQQLHEDGTLDSWQKNYNIKQGE